MAASDMHASIQVRIQGKLSDHVMIFDALRLGIPGLSASYLILGNRIAILDPASPHSMHPLRRILAKLNLDAGMLNFILVSHRHTDHASGAPQLLDHFPSSRIYAHEYVLKTYQDPARMNQAASQALGKFAEPIQQVRERDRLMEIKHGDLLELGEGLELEAVGTPGHTSDHLAYYERKTKFMFLGDCAGIMDPESLELIPTIFPPSFNPNVYRNSIQRMLQYEINILGFPHYGAILGSENCANILNSCLECLDRMKEMVSEFRQTGGSWRELAEQLRAKYTIYKSHPEFRERMLELLAQEALAKL